MIKHIYIISFFLIGTSIWAQQDPQYTQYIYTMNILNPAYVSTVENTTVTSLGRSQWVGIDGAPKTISFSFVTPLSRKLGLGFSVVHDEVGPIKENNVYLDLSYEIDLTEKSKLALGLKGGLTMLDINGLMYSDENFDPLDVPVSLSTANFGFGLFYYTNSYYLGLSIPNMIGSRHINKNNDFVSTSAEVKHYFAATGYVFSLSSKTKLKASTLFKFGEDSNLSTDLSANLFINNGLEFGFSHRWDASRSESISAVFAFNLSEKFRIGYAYDYTLTRFKDFNSGSYEIILRYVFGGGVKMKSPRYF